MPEITFVVRSSSCSFERVPKTMLWAHVQGSAGESQKIYDFYNTQISREYFEELAKR